MEGGREGGREGTQIKQGIYIHVLMLVVDREAILQ